MLLCNLCNSNLMANPCLFLYLHTRCGIGWREFYILENVHCNRKVGLLKTNFFTVVSMSLGLPFIDAILRIYFELLLTTKLQIFLYIPNKCSTFFVTILRLCYISRPFSQIIQNYCALMFKWLKYCIVKCSSSPAQQI